MLQSAFSILSLDEKQLVYDHLSVGRFSDLCWMLPHRLDATSTDSTASFVLLSHGLRERLFKRTRSRYASACLNPASLSPSKPRPELHCWQIHPLKDLSSLWSWSQCRMAIFPQHAQGLPDGGFGYFFLYLRRSVSASLIHGLHLLR